MPPASLGGLNGTAAQKGGQDRGSSVQTSPAVKGLLARLDSTLVAWKGQCTLDTDREAKNAFNALKPFMGQWDSEKKNTIRDYASLQIREMALDASNKALLEGKYTLAMATVLAACTIVGMP